MSQFNESDVVRNDKGQFASKGPSPEEAQLAATLAAQPYSSDDDPVTKNMWRDARASVLARAGYVPVTSASTVLDPKVAGDDEVRAKWWANEFVTAESNHPEGDYLQMPDDYTPSRTGGRALSGDRRTHRMNYSGAGMDIRMPSATAARRFAKENPGRTFDMPVHVRLSSGRTVQGHVRCTPGVNGRWDTEAVGFRKEDSDEISEGVNAVLEARRVRTALRDAGDLRERRERRLAERGIEHKPVTSSWIESAGYQDPNADGEGMMVMTTKPYMTKGLVSKKDGRVIRSPEHRPGRQYGFHVSREKFDRFSTSTEPGKTFNEIIKGKHDRFAVTECSRCHNFHQSDQPHTCGPATKPRTGEQVDTRQRQREAARAALPDRGPGSRLAALFGRGRRDG